MSRGLEGLQPKYSVSFDRTGKSRPSYKLQIYILHLRKMLKSPQDEVAKRGESRGGSDPCIDSKDRDLSDTILSADPYVVYSVGCL